MKRNHLLYAFLAALLLAFCFAACASAAEICPLDPGEPDMNNGTFCLTITDEEKIDDGGFFTVELYAEDIYDAAQIKGLVPGDTVWMNGCPWTVKEIVVHPSIWPGEEDTYEVFPEEEYYGYLVFEPNADGTFRAVIDDWVPVTFLGEVKVMLPLSDRFAYIPISSGEEGEPVGSDAFLEDLWMFGGFNAYNTTCRFEDGMLVSVTHSSYPHGPEEYWPLEEEPAPAYTEEIPVWQFCHGNPDLLETALIIGYSVDCEAGLFPFEVAEEEADEYRTLAMYGVVTGRESDEMVTGGTWIYSFETPEGEHIMSLELYRGLLVGPDGMYAYEIRR